MRRVERWMGIIVSRVARRVVAGKALQPGWLPRRWLTVVSGDVDLGGGIGAVWLVWRPGSAKAETHTALMERCGGLWRYTGGGSASGGDVAAGRSAAGEPGQVGMIECGGGAGGLGCAWRLQHPRSVTAAPWGRVQRVAGGRRSGPSPVRRAADRGARARQAHRGLEVPVHGQRMDAVCPSGPSGMPPICTKAA
jgi:hypothetical protein